MKTILLLDGPTGTELERRGVDTSRRLWSARAIRERPETLEAVHRDYIDAGADIVTINTFRTNRRAVVGSGLERADARRLTREATAIAHRARERSGRSDLLLAGSDAPVEDCYTPGVVPSDEELYDEHREHLRDLVDAGCDLILIETMNTLREAVIASRAAHELGRPFIVSVVTATEGEKLLSGEPLRDAVARLAPLEPAAILTNCASPSATLRATELLARLSSPSNDSDRVAGEAATLSESFEVVWKFGGYANSGEPHPVHGYREVRTIPIGAFIAHGRRMLEMGAGIIGSCCGTTPDYTRALAAMIDDHCRKGENERQEPYTDNERGEEERNDAE